MILTKGAGVDSIDEFEELPDDSEAKRRGWLMYKEAHAWFDDEQGMLPMMKSAYALPHHKFDDDGRFKTFFRGAIAAIAAINGARGGFTRFRSEDERRMVYEHLARHVREFDAEPPELKSIDDIERLSDIEIVDEIVKHFDSQGLDVSWLYKELGLKMDKEKNLNLDTSTVNENSEIGCTVQEENEEKSLTNDTKNVIENTEQLCEEEVTKDNNENNLHVLDLLGKLCEKIDNISTKDNESQDQFSDDVENDTEQDVVVAKDEEAAEVETENFVVEKENVDMHTQLILETMAMLKDTLGALSKSLEVLDKRIGNIESIQKELDEKIQSLEEQNKEQIESIKKSIVPKGNAIDGQEDETLNKSDADPFSGLLFGDIIQ